MTKHIGIYFALFMLIGQVFSAETPDQKGLRIAKLIETKNSGFMGEKSVMEMVLIDAHGTRVTRKLEGKVKEIKNDGDKSISIFLNPQDVKGTKMLTHSHKIGDDDQWLYLPSLKRVKRISSRGKSASFMGSEFSYEDLGSQETEKYDHNFVKDGKVGKHSVWILDRKSKAKSGYSKQLMYVSKKFHAPVKIEYFDRKGELLKVGEFSGFKTFKVKGKELYRSSTIHMKNLQTKKQSILNWQKRKLGVSYKERDFSKNRLKK